MRLGKKDVRRILTIAAFIFGCLAFATWLEDGVLSFPEFPQLLLPMAGIVAPIVLTKFPRIDRIACAIGAAVCWFFVVGWLPVGGFMLLPSALLLTVAAVWPERARVG
jgi:hypothetical protein